MQKIRLFAVTRKRVRSSRPQITKVGQAAQTGLKFVASDSFECNVSRGTSYGKRRRDVFPPSQAPMEGAQSEVPTKNEKLEKCLRKRSPEGVKTFEGG